MPRSRSRSETRADRLREMERLYLQRSFSDIEMAQRLGVDRTTVYRDRTRLEKDAPLIQDEDGRYRIDRSRYISSIRVDMSEALALYLAARRLSQQTRFAQKSVASGLEKLASALHQPMTARLVKAADRILSQQAHPERAQVFETVARAWTEGLQLRLTYRALGSRRSRRHLFRPYLLEPSPWSDGIYLIGHSDLVNQVLTLKLDRIERASLSGPFTIPEDFDDEALLRHAWGIWMGEGEPQMVTLRFRGRHVVRRLQESVWHPLEEVTEEPDGSVIWSAPIADWREMLPWIRGWGADVEVLGPDHLRQHLRREAQRLSTLYLNVREDVPNVREDVPAWFRLWAKADQATGETHPLLYHLIDVGATAHLMWRHVISDGEKARFSRLLGLSEEESGRFFAFLIASHDLGKASPAFQEKAAFARPILEGAGFHFPPSRGRRGAPHGFVTTWTLRSMLTEHMTLPKNDARDIAHVIGGHHGVWPVAKDIQDLTAYDKGDDFWASARDNLFQVLAEVFDPPQNVSLPTDIQERNALLMFLAGYTTTADWLGSMNEYFGYQDRFSEGQGYAEQAKTAAKRALEETGWLGWRASGEEMAFTEIFPFTPNDVQETVFQNALDMELPALVILEAPTGSGKTEAALYLADTWLQREQGKGMYVAMPTQATSNQMFQRTATFLQKRYPHFPLNIHLIHGNAAWTEQMQEIHLAGIGEGVEDGLVARTWFLPRKRTLLAPFGVGTVDQSFLSVLQARHFFLRLYGLGHKVVIFDEVHAYDTYMSQLFRRLLSWLRAMGTSVIVLSATLPEGTRRAMVAAYLDDSEENVSLEQAPYPRLTLASNAQTQTLSIPKPAANSVHLTWIDAEEIDALFQQMEERLADGGCAAIICNTVNRAQEIYTRLREARLIPEADLSLFHARMPFVWRKAVENRVLEAFGKPDREGRSPSRPHKAVVVATQVIEQSLDLDFDFMITELAPIDLILQRLGRLHRHQRETRPLGLSTPQVVVLRPGGDLFSPDFGGTQYVYDQYVLWQTWLALNNREEIRLPDDTTELIEAVYGPFRPEILPKPLRDPLQKAHEKMLADFRADVYQAQVRLAPSPDERGLVTRQQLALLDEDDPRVHEQLRAVTRLIGPTLNLVCLHRTPQGVFLEPDGSGPEVLLDEEPSRPLIRELMQRVVTIQHMGVIHRLKDKLPHPSWKKLAPLRYHLPIVFEDGVYALEDGSYTLFLDRELGLRIQKEVQ